MRLFVAIDIGYETRKNIAEVINSLKSVGFRAKFIEPDNLHITMKFLGDVRDDKIEMVCEELDEVVKKNHEFVFGLEGVGYFGKRNDIRVIWIGVKEGLETLTNIMKDIHERLNYIRKDDHEPVPHLTIARVRKSPENSSLGDELDKIRRVKFGEVRVKEVKIKRSILTRTGPIYSDIKSLSLRED